MQQQQHQQPRRLQLPTNVDDIPAYIMTTWNYVYFVGINTMHQIIQLAMVWKEHIKEDLQRRFRQQQQKQQQRRSLHSSSATSMTNIELTISGVRNSNPTITTAAVVVLFFVIVCVRSTFISTSDSTTLLLHTTTTTANMAYGVDSNTMAPAMPNVLIAGAQKGGTTTIAQYLKATGNACFSHGNTAEDKGEGKETHFFETNRVYKLGYQYYQSLFSNCESSSSSSPSYIIDGTPEAMKYPRRIKAIYDAADLAEANNNKQQLKIIISLREPVAREISWYRHRVRDVGVFDYANTVKLYSTTTDDKNSNMTSSPTTNETTTTAVKTFHHVAQNELYNQLRYNKTDYMYSTYEQYLSVLFQEFDRKQILVLSYEELQTDPTLYLGRIHKFLNLPGKAPTRRSSEAVPHSNADDGSSNDVDCDTQRKVGAWFEPYNNRLYELLQNNPGPDAEQRPFPHFTNKCWKKNEVLANPTTKRSPIPTVLIAGVQKGGTTSISKYLNETQHACFGSERNDDGTRREIAQTHFIDNSRSFNKGLTHYQDMYESCDDNPLLVDSTSDFIRYPRRVRALYEEHGTADSVKIIFTLRNPVQRDVASYRYRASLCHPDYGTTLCQKGGTPRPFATVMETEVLWKLQNDKLEHQHGLYSEYLNIWFELFSRDQILIVSYEESISDPVKYTQRIQKFLGKKLVSTKKNKSASIVPAIETGLELEAPCSVQEKLFTLYEPYNSALYELLKKNPGPSMEAKPFPKFSTKC